MSSCRLYVFWSTVPLYIHPITPPNPKANTVLTLATQIIKLVSMSLRGVKFKSKTTPPLNKREGHIKVDVGLVFPPCPWEHKLYAFI